jgi:hypothetical protein
MDCYPVEAVGVPPNYLSSLYSSTGEYYAFYFFVCGPVPTLTLAGFIVLCGAGFF